MNSFTLVKRHVVYARLLHNYLVTFFSSPPFFPNVVLVYSFRYYLMSNVYVYLYDGLFFQYLGLCCCVESRLDSETSDTASTRRASATSCTNY
jgi:hypothetical protein